MSKSISTSEYVSLGHPDKVADYISEYILDRYIEQDPDTRYAVEAQIKDSYVTLGGEVTSNAKFNEEQIAKFVKEAVANIGYTSEYQRKWGAENTISCDDIVVTNHIGQQSPDIAVGVDFEGWGDQGIFHGFATPDDEYSNLGKDHALAKKLCIYLYESGIGGIDIKTQVTVEDDAVTEVIVAIPLLDSSDVASVEDYVRKVIPGEYNLIVNGTGIYKRHGSIADCGTTGRKLAVDFYGGNCIIGGGSPWTKDASKADLTLNLLARKMAKVASRESGRTMYSKLSCCIGKSDVRYCIYDKNGDVWDSGIIKVVPSELKVQFGLDKPVFADLCKRGLFRE